MVSVMGFVLDPKAEMTLQSSSPNQANDNNDAGHLAGKRHERSTEECRDPEDDELEAMLSTLTGNPGISSETIGETYSADSGECNTVREAEVQPGAPVNLRASCPWTMKFTCNKNRYPSKIHYAECACTDCNGGQGSCKPITQPQSVLYKTQGVDGVYQYTLSTVDVNVACVCSRSSTS
ncbi:Interleukin 17-like protein [Holothuria leucospilota]|uniref:Interleukin 17-like protein n=1 Tax=Holothuria leucospilota TaxID=206669 RepID=A0A9Q1CQF6_HOLLE|nr:Interleukin 17-like protein [Holothuria leucospilota]